MQLAEGQRQIRDTARAFAEREIAPFAAESDRADGAPRVVLKKMDEAGKWASPSIRHRAASPVAAHRTCTCRIERPSGTA